VTSQHPDSQHNCDSFSPVFSNATADHASPAHRADAASAQKRSEPNGDHHLSFVDLADSAPTGHGQ